MWSGSVATPWMLRDAVGASLTSEGAVSASKEPERLRRQRPERDYSLIIIV